MTHRCSPALFFIGLILALCLGQAARADTIRLATGALSAPLSLPVHRAVVLESSDAFTEISIANPVIADISSLSDRTVYVLGKSAGSTTLTLLGENGRLISNITVQVLPDTTQLKERLQQILPGERIEVRSANDGIVLSGTVSSTSVRDRALELAGHYAPGKVSDLISLGGTAQVMLKVRFAEMARSVSKQLSASVSVQAAGARQAGTANTGSWLTPGNVPGGTIRPRAGSEGVFGISYTTAGVQLGLLLEALEAKGYVRTLAEPTLTALSGQEASFLAGGEYPVPVAGENGQTSILYKPFGVELSFLPHVRGGNLISLQLRAAVSGIDSATGVQSNGLSVSAFRRRETSTTVELRDGESIAIAGLLQDDFRDLKGQVPWLGDIPILGALFRSTQYERRQTELIIVITPYLIRPVREDLISLPTSRLLPPTEAELFLLGQLSRPAGSVASWQDHPGAGGYVFD